MATLHAQGVTHGNLAASSILLTPTSVWTPALPSMADIKTRAGMEPWHTRLQHDIAIRMVSLPIGELPHLQIGQ